MHTRESLLPRVNLPSGFGTENANSPTGYAPPRLNYENFGHFGQTPIDGQFVGPSYLGAAQPLPGNGGWH